MAKIIFHFTVSEHPDCAGDIECEQLLRGFLIEDLCEEGDGIHDSRLLGLKPEEAEHGPSEAELDRLCPAIKQLEEHQGLEGGKLVRVQEEEDVIVPGSLHHRHPLLAKVHPEEGVCIPAVSLNLLGEIGEEDVEKLLLE